MKRKKPWIRLPLAEKRQETLNRFHAPPAECLVCGCRTMPKDRHAHRARCPGRPSAHHLDCWEVESRTAARGLPRALYERAVNRGSIRSRRHGEELELLTRDVEQFVDAIELFGLDDEP